MTAEQLIAEGRKIQRPCLFLRTEKADSIAAIWYERDLDEIESTGERCWLSIDTQFIPGLPGDLKGVLSVFTDEEDYESGRVEISKSWPEKDGTKLYAFPAQVLPSLDDLFLRGSDAVAEWLKKLGWERDWGYNGNFKDKAVTAPYWAQLDKECPLYFNSDVYAVLGGSNIPLQYVGLLENQLAVLTLQESEPWIEVWFTKKGEFQVFQRIT